MKKRLTALILIFALSLTVLAGCAASAAGQELAAPEKSKAEQTSPIVLTADTKAPASTATEPQLTQEEAQTIALNDAGLTAADITELRVESDRDDSTPEYEVDFRSSDYEYDYTIHAETGAIREKDKEYDPPETRPTEPKPTEAPARITADEAKAIALAHAGLTAADVTRLTAEFEMDDGIPKYEVDFRSGDTEYDYTIHAETGAIREKDKEYDPPETRPTEPKPIEAPARITADEAKAIALAHAGLTEADVTELEAEYDVDDGVPEYEVEFRRGKLEYSYEIHAETGTVLSREIDD